MRGFVKMITPEQIAKSGTEHGEQAALMQWVALTGIKRWPNLDLLYAVPNGGDRSPSVASAMKAEGVKAGVPDLVLPIPVVACAELEGFAGASWYAGLYLEMKRKGYEGRALGARSVDQEKWHKRLIAQRYAVVTAYGWIAAVQVLETYLNGRLLMPSNGDCFFSVTNDTTIC